MKLSDISIKRPIFATMMILALVVLGLFSYARLGVDLFPNIDFPVATISTTLRGASPEEIETSVTKPVEEAVNTISGIDALQSISYEGLSVVVVTFVLEKNTDVGAQEVREAVGRILKELPQGTEPPVVQKIDAGASPIMSIAVSGDRPVRDVTEIAKKKVKEVLETIKGVGKITMVGGREREVHVIINPSKLKAFSVSIKQVKEALQQQNVEVPGGRVEEGSRELILRTMGRIDNAQEFDKIIVANINGVPVRIKDLGRVEDVEEEARTLARLDGVPTVSMVILKQSGMNTVEVIRNVKEELNTINATLPPGVHARIVRDQSDFILASVRTVQEHLILGAILASLVVLVFMGSIRSTIIASIAIPTSIIATYTLMDAAKFTLNNMTLLALALAVGVVIDDAIVVLENIFRHMEEDNISGMRAASSGTKEIGLAVMATTLSLVIIFLPLAYMEGIVGRFLKSYGLTVAFAIMVSLFIAFTLTPMLCSRFLKVQHGNVGWSQKYVDALNDWLKEYYGKMVLWAMAHRWVIVTSAVLVILSTGVIIRFVGKDFLPPDDSSEFEVNIKSPDGTSIGAMDNILKQMEVEIRRLPGVQNLLCSIGERDGAGVNEGLIYVRLKDLSQRKESQFDIMAMTRKSLSKYQSLKVSVTPVAMFSASGFKNADFMYVMSGPDLGQLQIYSEKLKDGLKSVKGFVDLDTSLNYAKPELKVKIDRNRAQDLGVNIQDIADSLRTMVGGEEEITKYKEGDNLYQVRLRVDKDYRDDPAAIGGLYLPSSKVGPVRLDNVAHVVEENGPSQIDRYNRQRQVTVFANLENVPIGYAIENADRVAKTLNMPPGYKTGLLSKGKEFARMMHGFMMAFLLSLIFMYMVLASQFESFLHPVTIMLSLPLSIPFALLSLLITGQNLTIFSIMGVFMLFGIVKKNAILQVDYTNTLRARGLPRDLAILEANKTRLRPILMTTTVLVAAMLPVAFGTGPGSSTRATMAVVIVGGQTMCLLITLLLTPVAYSLFDDLGTWFNRKFRKGHLPEPHAAGPGNLPLVTEELEMDKSLENEGVN